MDPSNLTILTTGHSTRPIEKLIRMLHDAHVELLADVRTVPRSRHNPQFSIESLAPAIGAAGIEYRHLPALGGLRRPHKDSPNTAWRNDSFRGFADYMQTEEFETALEELLRLAAGRRVAIMCSEGAPFRCHRSLIADALVARGVAVSEIGVHGRLRPHRMTPFAQLQGAKVTYPPAP